MKTKFEVSLFLSLSESTPIQTINLWDWLSKKSIYMDIVNEIRSTNNSEKIKSLKAELPAITPSGVFSIRKLEFDNLIKPTNLVCIDIDWKDNLDVDIDVLKIELSKNPYIMYCGLSASGRGLFCLIKIDDYKQHKRLYGMLQSEFEKMNVIIDSSCSNFGRLRFYSYDSQPVINPDSMVYSSETECFVEYCPESLSHIQLKKEFDALEIAWRELSSTDVHTSNDVNIPLEEAFLRPTIAEYSPRMQSKIQMTEKLIYKVISSKIDITKNHKDWTDICGIIAVYFKERGRSLFHGISSFYPSYTLEECNHLYDSYLSKNYHPSTEKLFFIAQKYGIS
jgi:hypothetical protein